jgi:uncharacterized protein YjiS (DUF1127 family)
MTSLIMTADTIGLHKVSDWIKGIAKANARRTRANATIKELSKLTDYELNDIGISRGEIYSIAWEVHKND